ncbi:MAG: endo-1,4-beta-xylanase [Phycisphaerae bacterium]|nr:endo-1,4-beta-xylanase [Phycisphaerae bacterium]
MKFQVFKEGVLADKADVGCAYLSGTDGIVLKQVDIKFADGVIECNKPNLSAASLSLMWEVLGFGKIMLSTTTLPQREEPYILNLELARSKLMNLITKREDWQFFNGLGELEQIWQQARELFIEAVKNISDASRAAKLADESLSKSVVLSEKLAVRYGRELFAARVKNKLLAKGSIGCVVELGRVSDKKYLKALVDNFSYVTIPMAWSDIEKEPGKYDFGIIDKLIPFFAKNKIVIGAGPLVCFDKKYIPKWLLDSNYDFEQIKDAAYNFVMNVVSRYSGHIRAWRVISGLNYLNYFGFNFEQILEMTRATIMAAKACGDKSLKIIDVANLWGEYYSSTEGSIPPIVYMDLVVQNGIGFDVFGVQMKFGKDAVGMHTRDMMQISAKLDHISLTGKPFFITEVEVPSCSREEAAGSWHNEWSEQTQSEWVEDFYKISLGRQFVETVTYGNLMDRKGSDVCDSGLVFSDGKFKQSYATIKKVREPILNKGK